MMQPRTILIVDDEKDLLELLRYNLEKEHLDVICAADGASGLNIALKQKPDLIVLDLMMPGMDGLEVCRKLRADARTAGVPIIMLTAKAAETDKIIGLETGADDYITKPFSPREFVARVRAVLRRSAGEQPPGDFLRRGELAIDLAAREVTWGGEPVPLTATEFRILQYLATRPARVVTRDDLIDGALGRDASIFNRTIDVHITALRKKLGPGGARIETVRGFGYKWAES